MTALSAKATEHFGLLLAHRADLDVLDVTVHPYRCSLCAEIANWDRAITMQKWRDGIGHRIAASGHARAVLDYIDTMERSHGGRRRAVPLGQKAA